MKKLILGLCLLTSSLAWAQDSDILTKSYMCKEEYAQVVQGVTCCLDQFALNQCQKIVQELIPQNQIERVMGVKERILKGEFGYKENPNCHWNALAFYYPTYFDVAQPMLDLDLYGKLINDDFVEVEEGQAHHGDLVVFYETEVRQREMVEVGGRPRLIWVKLDGEYIFHSAVYLGANLVFQKENLDSSIFSFGTLESVQKLYNDLANQNTSMRQAKIKYRLYRKN